MRLLLRSLLASLSQPLTRLRAAHTASKAAADAAWAASSSSAAAAAKETQSSSDSGSSSGGSGKVYSGGIATFFYQNGVAGVRLQLSAASRASSAS